MEYRIDISKRGMAAILVRHDYIGRGTSPIYAEAWIIPCKSSFIVGCPVISYFVDYLAIGLQRNVAMRKTLRQPQLLPICRRKLQCDMATVCGRFLTYVDGNVQDGSPNAPHQFALGARGNLEMQSS